MQVNSEAWSGGRSLSMTSSDDRKWSGGAVWSLLRVMLDVTLLQRLTFVILALSVLLCYFGQSLAEYFTVYTM